jgi:hypothetical protein
MHGRSKRNIHQGVYALKIIAIPIRSGLRREPETTMSVFGDMRSDFISEQFGAMLSEDRVSVRRQFLASLARPICAHHL